MKPENKKAIAQYMVAVIIAHALLLIMIAGIGAWSEKENPKYADAASVWEVYWLFYFGDTPAEIASGISSVIFTGLIAFLVCFPFLVMRID